MVSVSKVKVYVELKGHHGISFVLKYHFTVNRVAKKNFKFDFMFENLRSDHDETCDLQYTPYQYFCSYTAKLLHVNIHENSLKVNSDPKNVLVVVECSLFKGKLIEIR